MTFRKHRERHEGWDSDGWPGQRAHAFISSKGPRRGGTLLFCLCATTQRPEPYLVLEHGSPKGPDGGEHKVELIKLLGAVCRRVFWSEQTLQQVAKHLDHTLLRDRDDLLKPDKRDVMSLDSPKRRKHKHKHYVSE